ncbi:D-alanyl-D-alanine-carboxypeptidase/endopeptidase AmpH [Cladorrhinum samala]|uniref:D-alanyl-D-alanine-carboxypeptidase/endopeptidase AmpH n=1 Tax=Cladorrhinum samala TaxID=585594 RepID=A0AAV9HQP6_9PEZI|nr:D-alanyl-D-alanine-carboxypeptidase/endopeptidase AmpH [Cladorrhinum samala]
MSKPLILLGAIVGFSAAQNCPILGPAYPPVTEISSSNAFGAARATADKLITDGLASGQLDNQTSAFSVQVFSIYSDDPVYEYHHAAPALNLTTLNGDTIYRIGSISKLITVYTILSKLPDWYWDEPVSKYIPELSGLAPPEDSLAAVDWSKVTLGALASQMGGIGRDYTLGDLSAIPPGSGQILLPGLPPIAEPVRCGSVGFRPCTRAEAMAGIISKPPVTDPYRTPIYSNMGFQLLAYAVENITGRPFPDLVRDQLLVPLNLTRTFLSNPGNDSNAVVVPGYDEDIGDEAPAGAYYQSLSDLGALGASILSSTILPEIKTRRWLQPTAHTSTFSISVGRPWEIFREKVLTDPRGNNNKTRIVDMYTKNGGLEQYVAHLALSPDHGMGIAVLTAGGGGQPSFFFLQEMLYKVFLGTAESAAREKAAADFGGKKNNGAGDREFKGDLVEFGLDGSGEPGLFLSRLVSNGTDMLEAFGTVFGVPEGVKLGGWLYPVGRDSGRAAFRAVFGAVGVDTTVEDRCLAWGSVDQLRYGGNAVDLFVFELDDEGKATEVRVVALGRSIKRTAKGGD